MPILAIMSFGLLYGIFLLFLLEETSLIMSQVGECGFAFCCGFISSDWISPFMLPFVLFTFLFVK